METFLTLLSNYWWVLVLIAMVAGFKFVFRFVLGGVIVPDDRVGLVTKIFALGKNRELPPGRIIACNGEAGMQAEMLAPGIYLWMYPWQYSIELKEFVQIPQGKIGLLLARDGAEIPTGKILGRRVDCDSFQDAKAFLSNNGQKGRQASVLTAGSYRINTNLFEILVTPMVQIKDNMVGIITTLDGIPLPSGHIAGEQIGGHNNFQDFDMFLQNNGRRGLQEQVVLAGSYNINPWAVQVEEKPMTEIPIGYVGVVISFVGTEGADVTGSEFKHGNIVRKGEKGVWIEPYGPGKYPINPYTMKIELVPTTNLVLNWANARTESHNLDQNLNTITVRSKDGFKFNLDVSQIIHVPLVEAPKVIARFGSMSNLVSQVLEPTIGNYFRNSAQDSDVISFLTSRKERQDSAKAHIKTVLDEYNVNAVDTLIGDIVPPETLMETLTNRKIAEEQRVTYTTQMEAQKTRQALEQETAVANVRASVVEAEQGIIIAEKKAQQSIKTAEGDSSAMSIRAEGQAQATIKTANAEAKKIEVTGEAEASKILAIGKSNAESYKLAVDSMGDDNFTRMKVVEYVGSNNVKIIPEILITGGASGGGALEGMLGMQLMNQMKEYKRDEEKSESSK
jgi:uncharacterized membrane protein YqiK